MSLSLLCRVQQDRPHDPCGGTTDDGTDGPCTCACHAWGGGPAREGRYFIASTAGGSALLYLPPGVSDASRGLEWEEVDSSEFNLEFSEVALRQLARRHPEHPALTPYLPEDERPPGARVFRLDIGSPDIGREGMGGGWRP